MPHVSTSRYTEERKAEDVAMRIFREGREQWEARSPFRKERARAVDLRRGNHWTEMVDDPDNPGRQVTLEELIERGGRVSMVMNLAENIVKVVQGQFRANKSDRSIFAADRQDEQAVEMMNRAFRASRRHNNSDMVEADQAEEHITSGASAFKSSLEWDSRLNRIEVTENPVNQTRLFYNTDVTDRRMSGLRIVGELHDVTIDDAVASFARSKAQAEEIRSYYGQRVNDRLRSFGGYGFDFTRARDWYTPADATMARVIEIWCEKHAWVRVGIDPLFEVIPGGYGEVRLPDNELARIQNARRDQGLPLLELDEPRYEPYWQFYFFTPDRNILATGHSQFMHGEHPYTIGLSKLVDGETWGIISSVEDPQMWLNRIMSHIDAAMGTGAKGNVAYDEQFLEQNGLGQADVDKWFSGNAESLGVSVPQGKTLADFVEVYTNERLPAGYVELIPVLTEFITRVSGVTGAMQGLEPPSGTPASLYQQQVAQASLSILSDIETYFETLHDKDKKQLQLLLQSINEPRTYATKAFGGQPVTLDPDRIRNIEYDVAVGSVMETATQRMLYEDRFYQLVLNGLIPPSVYFKHSSDPNAAEILEDLTVLAQAQSAAMQAEAQSQQGQDNA